MTLLEATNAGPEWEALTAREEHKYQDLIDSRLWQLVRSDGQLLHILIPNFCCRGEINWRYDLGP